MTPNLADHEPDPRCTICGRYSCSGDCGPPLCDCGRPVLDGWSRCCHCEAARAIERAAELEAWRERRARKGLMNR